MKPLCFKTLHANETFRIWRVALSPLIITAYLSGKLFFLASVCSILSFMGGNVNFLGFSICWILIEQPPKTSHGTQKKLHKMIPAIASLLPSGAPLLLFIFLLAISPKTSASTFSFQAASQPCNRSLSVLSPRLQLTIRCFFFESVVFNTSQNKVHYLFILTPFTLSIFRGPFCDLLQKGNPENIIRNIPNQLRQR